ncbi:MAG: AarF/ABC1/UbiB kinase family protein [Leptospiraceae bacterium]|nr:AarF/ABC1/UbiB kinase family protein [Leptospiraceae bacterium]
MLDELLNGIDYSIKSAFRIGQTTLTLAQTGMEWVLGDRPPAPALLRQTFERLGATYVKLGQFIASSPSLFPEEYVNEFQKCLDKTDPLPFSTIERILKRELGRDYKKHFSSIEKQPLASASIAQVHAARLQNGSDVVLKIQKPDVADILLTDLNFLYVSARILEILAPSFARTSLTGIIEDIQKTMLEECDFLNEARNIREFDRFLKDNQVPNTVVPRVYDELTTLHVLTMERFFGVPLTDLESIKKYTQHPEMTLINALNTWFASLVQCSFFHADVHAGNLMVLENGDVGFIDFGIVGRIKKETWQSMNDLMTGMAANDFELIARSMLGIGATDQAVDVQALALDLEKLFTGMENFAAQVDGGNMAPMGLLVEEAEVNQMLIEMVQVGEKYGIRFPREFGLLMKQFLYFDRYIRILSPGMDLFQDPRLQRMALN